MRALKTALGAIWRLTIPYFTTHDVGEINLRPFGRFRVQERWLGIGLVLALILINLGQVGLNVRLSFFNRDLFNALQNKDAVEFWQQLLFVFCPLAAVYVTVAIIEIVIQYVLRIRWRRWLTRRYVDSWLGEDTHYKMQLLGYTADNPDQRIADDIDQFIVRTQTLTLGLLTQVATLFSFAAILWSLSSDFTLPGTDVPVPGLLLWFALGYAVLGTWLTHKIGKPLIRLNFDQQRYEADFRFSLARLREYAEQVALLDGESAEKERLAGRFGNVVRNFMAIVDRTKKLTAFTASYFQASVVVPYILTAPYFFVGRITLGQLQQTAGSFSRVEGALTFFISAYTTLADYKAVVDRLTSFDTAMKRARSAAAAPPRIDVALLGGAAAVRIVDLDLRLPAGTTIVRVPELALRRGETTLLTGPSGSGKSTLFRAIAGIWPFGSGTVTVPTGENLLLLPQRPYIPIGSLRGAVAYPAATVAYSGEAIRDALEAVRLPHLVERLDEEGQWAQTLSLGEQQRVALARALLAKPDWLFLDEATAALDEPLEQAMYELIMERLPETTVVSIGHRSTLIAFHERRIDLRPGRDGRIFMPHEVDVPAMA
ncbi:ABC transporter ATP-binding protein/permease [Chelatococcus sp. SYSU_G07232]|uniref:ABC transporter ATP-binding protein/permease n=1 Tax=Chelatococcus albus TaxID=3047466 RepID=A0ABT7AEU9_9HYPH|nr:ABC transporter ATP-binding protein/permease [Chelatococcus sp. SYSU_G07232]MDJ1157896.1 ABC transporter ATP-binding protein/permease [Chelatococcus sp. SYSU_G07232]